MRQLAIVFTFIIVLLLAAAPLASAQDAPSLAGSNWTLVSIDGQAVADGTEITLAFDEDGRVGGSAGCNSYGGEYTFGDGSLTFGGLFSTMMACEDAIMQQESAYLAALQSATRAEWAEGQLVIVYGEGQQLVFAPALTLERVEWSLVSIDGAPLVDGTDVTIAFDGEGVAGSAGCNRYSGSYTLDGDTITFGPFVTTRMACPQPIMQQESAFLTALEGAANVTIANGQLTIVTANGVTLVFETAPSLTGGEWTLVSLGSEAVLGGAPLTINFAADGSAFGSSGCNSYRAPYTVDGDSITFGSGMMTLMACDDAFMAQERTFLTALEAATAYRIADGQLVIVYGDGQELIFDAVLPVVTVTLTYRERIALPENAEVTVTIEDIARADAPADVLVSLTIVSGGANVPFTFELPYDPAQLDDRAMYSARAQIRVDGALWFTSDTIAPVLSRGAGTEVELVLVRVP